MSKLKQLQEKYEKAKYEPDENCIICYGNGEFYRETEYLGNWHPCYCIFKSLDFLPFYKETMAKTLSKIRGGSE